MSSGNDFRGPWNQGTTPQTGDAWQFIDDPIRHVIDTNALLDQDVTSTSLSGKKVDKLSEELGELRSKQVNAAVPIGEQQWNDTIRTNGVS
jgi:Mn-containing catalase